MGVAGSILWKINIFEKSENDSKTYFPNFPGIEFGKKIIKSSIQMWGSPWSIAMSFQRCVAFLLLFDFLKNAQRDQSLITTIVPEKNSRLANKEIMKSLFLHFLQIESEN